MLMGPRQEECEAAMEDWTVILNQATWALSYYYHDVKIKNPYFILLL